MGDIVNGDLNNTFKITFEDGSTVYKTGSDYTSSTVTTREHIAAIFNNKENQVISIEIMVGCNIPFYTNNTNYNTENDTLISKYIKSTGLLFSNLPKLTRITVDPANLYLSSIDGVLFSKDGTLLYAYPPGKTSDTYEIPSQVTRINCLSFMKTVYLKEVKIPNNTSIIIWLAAFAHATGLTKIIIPDNINTIYPYGFAFCKNLSTITLSNRTNYYGPYSFLECISLINIYFPNSPSRSKVWLYEGCFYDCKNLTSVHLPDTIQFYENGKMFWNCSGLSSIRIPDGVKILPVSIFAYCESLILVTLPNTLTEIHSSAFTLCKKIESIVMPSSLLTLQWGGFWIMC
jgi:hypothetical protein